MPKTPRWKRPAAPFVVTSITEAAKRLGMSRDTFVNLSNAGVLTRGAEGWESKTLVAQLEQYETDARGKKGAVDSSEKDFQMTRLRAANADIAELELAKMRGEMISRESVHLALAQVVEIVKADLLGVGNWGAGELANMSGEAIAEKLDRKMRTIAEGFQRKCGDVRLIDPEKSATPKPKRGTNRPAKKKWMAK